MHFPPEIRNWIWQEVMNLPESVDFELEEEFGVDIEWDLLHVCRQVRAKCLDMLRKGLVIVNINIQHRRAEVIDVEEREDR
jgi:hypothetical protein